MMTKTGLWLTYIASCKYVYFLLIAGKFLSRYSYFNTVTSCRIDEKLIACLNEDKWIYLILLTLIVFSTIWNRQWKRVRHNTRIKFKPEKDGTLDVVFAVFAYFAIVFTTSLNTYGIIINLVMFVVLGATIVRTGNIQVCLYFLFHGYHIYHSGKNKILTQKSLEEYLLLLDESPDGIEARELTKQVYIVSENR